MIIGVLLAHENYVLTKAQIDAGMADFSVNVFNALNNQANLFIAIKVILGSLLLMLAYFVFQQSSLGLLVDRNLKKLEPIGHIVLRIALAASLFASAATFSFLGPEIPLSSIPFADTVQYLLVILGIFLLIGLFTEFAGFIFFILLTLSTFVYKDYMLTYVNYLGEALALIIFGSRTLAVDNIILPSFKFREKFKDSEKAIIRITYGISIMYPAIVIKLTHPKIIVDIVNQYHLNQFAWILPRDPLLISLGTGLAQIAVGTALILGFQVRLNALITFILYILSILFFKEAVWPHYILLALAFYLFLNNGGEWGLDSFLQKKLKKLNIKLPLGLGKP